MKIHYLVLYAVFIAALLPLKSRAVNPIITGALITAGATLLTSGGGGGGGQLYSFKGQNINANDCWEDGSGPCPNGNSLWSFLIPKMTLSCFNFRQLFG